MKPVVVTPLDANNHAMPQVMVRPDLIPELYEDSIQVPAGGKTGGYTSAPIVRFCYGPAQQSFVVSGGLAAFAPFFVALTPLDADGNIMANRVGLRMDYIRDRAVASNVNGTPCTSFGYGVDPNIYPTMNVAESMASIVAMAG
jgi:hypothetical protein